MVCRRTRSWRIVGSVLTPAPCGQFDHHLGGVAERWRLHRRRRRLAAASARSRRRACRAGRRPCRGSRRSPSCSPPPAPRPARSWASVVLATAQPLLSPPIIGVGGTRASDMNTSLNRARPVISLERTDVDAVLVHVDREVGDALVLGDVGVGAGDQHAEVGDLAAGGPHLLAVDDPLVAVEHRLGLQAGEVGAGAGLAEQLTPRLLAGDDVADVALDLLLGPVGGDRRRGEQQAEAARGAEGAELGDRVGDEHGVAARQAAGRRRSRAASVPTSRRGRGAPTTPPR